MEIFKLVGSIFVDTDKANESISKTDKKASGLGTTFAKGVTTAAKWGAGIAAGATAAATAVGALVVKTSENADNIDKMSQKIGISTDEYQKWSYAMELAGADVDLLQSGMKTMSNAMADAANGSSTAAAKFDALGVSIYDESGALKSQEDMLNEVILKLAEMDEGAERSALATDLLGKSATELAPLLNSGAEAILESKQAAEDLGLVMSETAVKDGAAMNDSITTIKESFTAMANKLGSSVMPIVQKLLDFVIERLPMVQGLFDKLTPVVELLLDSVLPPIIDLVDTLLPVLVDIIDAVMPLLMDIVNAILPVFVDLVNMLLPPFVQIVKQLLPPLLSLLSPILSLLSPILKLLEPIIDLAIAVLDPIAKLINKFLTPLITIIVKVIELALVPLQSSLTSVSGILSSVVKFAIDGIINSFTTWKGILSGFITFIKGAFTGDWKAAWQGVAKVFASIFEGIKTAFKLPINFIIDGINSFIKGINKLKIPDWVPGVGGKGFAIQEIPKLEKGGVLEKGQTGFLEGNGAEAVVPLESNKAWISAVAKDMQNAGISGMNAEVAEGILDRLEGILNRLNDIDFKAEIVADTDKMFTAYAKRSREALALGRA